MKFNEIIDPLYGKIQLPSFINQLLLCPELLRLKEIRMSNINFFNFTGFSDSSRYEHAVGTAFLAHKMTERWPVERKDKLEIITAALFHDVATPSFGHVTESVYKEKFNFDHEKQTAEIILGQISDFRKTDIGPIYAGECPRLKQMYEKTHNPKLEIKNVFLYTQGKGKFGKMIKSDIDLDNIDNVFRSAYHIGLQIDKSIPLKLASSFIFKGNGTIEFKYENRYLIKKWLEVRNNLYTHLLLNTLDLNRERMLKYAITKAVDLEIMKKTDWLWTDNELLSRLTDPERIKLEKYEDIPEIINRVRLGIFFLEIGLYWISDCEFYSRFINNNHLLRTIEIELNNLLKTDVVINIIPDKRSRRIDGFRLMVDDLLFRSALSEDEKKAVYGEQHENVLLCVYSFRSTIVKRDELGKNILDKNNKQIMFRKNELRLFVLDYLKKYVRNSNNIGIFNNKVLKSTQD